MASHPGPSARRRSGGGTTALKGVAYALLLGECLVILIPSVYGRAAPKLFGIPFFYWFQLLWIIVGMVVTGIAYLLFERAEGTRRRAASATTGAAHENGGGRG
jgi:Protein of unknown function (DUF3311)